MLQKVGHAAQGEGNCRAGGTRCCSERKLQAVQRFLPGYDIIASRLDFSVWKRMKNLAGNLQPLIYGAFPVWRNCTVRAHICNLGASEWRKRKNGVEYARTFRCRLHAPHLHPRYTADAGKRRRKDGKFHGAGDVKKVKKKHRAAERMRRSSSPPLSESSPCGSACGSNPKTQRKNCAAVIKDEIHLSDEHKPSELKV